MAPGGLQITFRRSGGIAGLDLVAATAADELPAPAAQAATSLLAVSPPPTPTAARGGAADQFSYELHLDDGSTSHTYRWPESAVPEGARALLAALNDRAVPSRPE